MGGWLSPMGVVGFLGHPLARVLEGVHDLGLRRSLLHLVVVLPARRLGERHENALDASAWSGLGLGLGLGSGLGLGLGFGLGFGFGVRARVRVMVRVRT